MKSFQDIYQTLQRRSRNSDATQLLEFKKDINTTQQLVLSRPWKFLEKTSDIPTIDCQQDYELPIDCKNNQIMEVEMQVSSTTIYRPKIVDSAKFWEYLLSRAVDTSDVTQYVYIYDEKLYCWPTPTTASLTLRVRHRKIPHDLSFDDYTTGKILTAVYANPTITGGVSGDAPSWTPGMAGRYLRITTTAAANGGDGFWYEISAAVSSILTLVKNYVGATITAGAAAYTIGEMPLIPEPYQDLLVYRPLAIYFSQNGEDLVQADRYWKYYDGGYSAGLSPRIGGLLGAMLDELSGSSEGVFMDSLEASEPSLSDLSIKNYDYNSGGTW